MSDTTGRNGFVGFMQQEFHKAGSLEKVGAAFLLILSVVSPIHATLRPLYVAALAALLARHFLARINLDSPSLLSKARRHRNKCFVAFLFVVLFGLLCASYMQANDNSLRGGFGESAATRFGFETQQADTVLSRLVRLNDRGSISDDELVGQFSSFSDQLKKLHERHKNEWVPLQWVFYDRCSAGQYAALENFLKSWSEAVRNPTPENAATGRLALRVLLNYFDDTSSSGFHRSGAACRNSLVFGFNVDDIFKAINKFIKR